MIDGSILSKIALPLFLQTPSPIICQPLVEKTDKPIKGFPVVKTFTTA
jgi:hypothetical protein